MILVTGATGQYGAQVINHLLDKGVEATQICALVRDNAKEKDLLNKGVALRRGDYSDFDSLVKAFQDVDQLLSVSSNDRGAIENRTAHHMNVIHAAKVAQVNHLIYTSFIRKPAWLLHNSTCT